MHRAAIWGLWKINDNRWIGKEDQYLKYHRTSNESVPLTFFPLVSPGWTQGSLKTESENQTWIESSRRSHHFWLNKQKGDSLMLRGSRENGPLFLFSVLLCPSPQTIPRWWWHGRSGACGHLESWERGTSHSDLRSCGLQGVGAPLLLLLSLCSAATWPQI